LRGRSARSRRRRNCIAAKIIAAPTTAPIHNSGVSSIDQVVAGLISCVTLSTLSGVMWLRSALPNQLPGTRLSRARPTMFCQNQPDSRLNTFIRSNQLTKMPLNTGIMIAHRNGLLFAQAEHSSSQPAVGSAHSA
jgi:hypothetical protein